MIGRTMVAAVVGGTVSQITGGTFANGAMTAAFVHLFNAESTIKMHFKRYLRFNNFPADGKLKDTFIKDVNAQFSGTKGKYQLTVDLIESTNGKGTSINYVDSYEGTACGTVDPARACAVGDKIYFTRDDLPH